jgi:hypothetical protein
MRRHSPGDAQLLHLLRHREHNAARSPAPRLLMDNLISRYRCADEQQRCRHPFPQLQFPGTMKRQTRPFAVEIKGVRKRPSKNLFGRRQAHHGDAQPSGANQDLAAMWASFGQITNDGARNNVIVLDCATPASPIVERQIRVLPDLREVASNEAPVLKKARRPRSSKPEQVLEPAYQESNELAIQVETKEAEPLADTLASSQKSRCKLWPGRKQLPRGERWKERRLPPICWR